METRERILKSAWTLLEAEESQGVRMADIAKAAGISRQAVYLHFPTRAELLVATTRYIDGIKDLDARLVASRAASTGVERLNAFITAWGNYIPEIYGVGRALMAMASTDAEAGAAWNNRMQAMREGCEAAVKALKKDGTLVPGLAPKQATDILWMLLSVRNWEHLTQDCGWPQKRYVETMKDMAGKCLVGDS